jgi:predicted nucleic acid-binding protein
VPSIAVDAGPLVALFDGSDKHHADAIAFVQRAGFSLVTNLLVLAEVAALLPSRYQIDLLSWTEEGVEIDWGTVSDFPRIITIMRKYDDLPADLADASLLAMCERRGIREVATLDKDFDVYRTADRKRLRNVFLAE